MLLIIFRNLTTGLRAVLNDVKDAGCGLGYMENQLLWKVEVVLVLSEIIVGLRIDTTMMVGLVIFAFFAGVGGMGERFVGFQIVFKSNVVVAGGFCVLFAIVFDLLILKTQ